MNWWSDKRILVTGGSGFLGTHLLTALRARGAGELIAPRRSDYDLRDRDAVRRMFTDISGGRAVDVVIHLAAHVGGIGANRARPAEFFYDNLLMGTHVLHEAWRSGVGKAVAVGTVCGYPKLAPVPFNEDDLWSGYPEATNAPYGLAKKMLLVQSQAYREQYGFNSIFLLPTNLYGPGDHVDPATSHVIPALIRKFLDARHATARGERPSITVWGTGAATREFLYVADAAEAILLAAERYDGPEPVNLGSQVQIRIAELVRCIADALGVASDVVWDHSKPDGQPRRCLDTSRAERLFGFRASTPFQEGLKKTIDWYLRLDADATTAAAIDPHRA